MNKLKIIGVMEGLVSAKRKVSGTKGFLYYHLNQSGVIEDIVDIKVNYFLDKINMAMNFSLNKNIWLFKVMVDVKRKKLKSLAAKKKLEQKTSRVFNSILQIGSTFNLNNIKELYNVPKFSYHDNNLIAYLHTTDKIVQSKRIEQAIQYEHNVYNNLDAIFTMTEYLKKSFVNDFNIDNKKVFNIGFGSNIDSTHDFPKFYDCKSILFIAKDSFKEKGGYDLLKAFDIVSKEIENSKLYIVGQIIKCKNSGVVNIPFLDKNTKYGYNKLIQLYQKSSLFVMPSYVDATGNVFLEAMSYKLPCIGANVSAMPEIIVDNNCGEVVEPGDVCGLADKIIKFLKNRELLEYYGNNGLYAVRSKFNWDNVCKNFINIAERYIC